MKKKDFREVFSVNMRKRFKALNSKPVVGEYNGYGRVCLIGSFHHAVLRQSTAETLCQKFNGRGGIVDRILRLETGWEGGPYGLIFGGPHGIENTAIRTKEEAAAVEWGFALRLLFIGPEPYRTEAPDNWEELLDRRLEQAAGIGLA